MNATEPAEILPCPCCGNTCPWTFLTYSCCVLRCDCGIELNGAVVRAVYKKTPGPECIPDELLPFAKPADALRIRSQGGALVDYPEHGYYSVSVVESFRHFGFLDKWNRRAVVGGAA